MGLTIRAVAMESASLSRPVRAARKPSTPSASVLMASRDSHAIKACFAPYRGAALALDFLIFWLKIVCMLKPECSVVILLVTLRDWISSSHGSVVPECPKSESGAICGGHGNCVLKDEQAQCACAYGWRGADCTSGTVTTVLPLFPPCCCASVSKPAL